MNSYCSIRLVLLACCALGTTQIIRSESSPARHASQSISVTRPEAAESVPLPKSCPTPQKDTSFAARISNALQSTASIPLQALLALLLGLLMSLTPCIYPMIPITMGVLQAQGARSVWRNFVLAFSYTLGIACTFAALGLAAVFSGQLFGSLATNPFVVIAIALLMFYLAGTMLGLYEMYIPRFLQNAHGPSRGGSVLSAFAIGAVSGTVASPCLSPGLLLLLSVVASLGSMLAGFLLLFCFGFGIGLPLLLIGTFSGSLTALPRAGAWMVEIKRLFGLLLVAMGLYYLKAIMSPQSFWILVACTVIALGYFYISLVKKTNSKLWIWHQCVTILLFSFWGMYVVHKVIQPYTTTGEICSPEQLAWSNDYACARAQAAQESKLLFIDVGSPSCSLCHAIDAELLSDKTVMCELEQYTVPLKIDASQTTNSSTQLVSEQFPFYGVPALFLIDPTNETILQQWGSELYEQEPGAFIKQLHTHIPKQ